MKTSFRIRFTTLFLLALLAVPAPGSSATRERMRSNASWTSAFAFHPVGSAVTAPSHGHRPVAGPHSGDPDGSGGGVPKPAPGNLTPQDLLILNPTLWLQLFGYVFGIS